MANKGFLLNSSSPVWASKDVEVLRTKPDHADGVVAESANRLLIPWLLCFRREDLAAKHSSLLSWFRRPTEPPMPCTTVEQAIRRLDSSLPIFEAIVGNAVIAKPYWELACTCLRRLPFKYLALDTSEILQMRGDLGEFSRQMERALVGDLSALSSLKKIVEYHDEIWPYPLDVLYNVAEGPSRRQRNWNASVMDAGFLYDFESIAWHLPEGMPKPESPGIQESYFGELRQVRPKVSAWVKEVEPNVVGTGLGLTLTSEGEGLQIYTYLRNEVDLERVHSNMKLRLRLKQFGMQHLEPWCKRNGLAWAGWRCSIPEWARAG